MRKVKTYKSPPFWDSFSWYYYFSADFKIASYNNWPENHLNLKKRSMQHMFKFLTMKTKQTKLSTIKRLINITSDGRIVQLSAIWPLAVSPSGYSRRFYFTQQFGAKIWSAMLKRPKRQRRRNKTGESGSSGHSFIRLQVSVWNFLIFTFFQGNWKPE